jgi:DKNYY family
MLKSVKWIIKTVLLFTGILPLLKCSSGYEKKDGKITFNGREITDKNFVVLNDVFAKDSLDAYYKEKSITGAEVATFEAVNTFYAKDKNRVYYCDEFRDGQNYYLTKHQVIKVVEKAFPASFKAIEAGYAKDSVHGFNDGLAFTVKDISSLKGIDRYFAKDNVQVYFNCKPIAGSDGKTFEVINTNYAKDTTHIYYYGYPGETKASVFVLPCNRASFQILDYPFSKDNAMVFFENLKINGADAASFTVLKHGYSKDKNAAYIQTKKIAGADAASFEVFKENDELTQDYYYTKDRSSIYWLDKKVMGADIASFTVLGHGYGSDGKNVFFKTSSIKNADPKSFKVYPHDFGDADAEDAKMKYHDGKKAGEE